MAHKLKHFLKITSQVLDEFKNYFSIPKGVIRSNPVILRRADNTMSECKRINDERTVDKTLYRKLDQRANNWT